MELEERVQALERQVTTLEQEIQATLLAIRANLPEKPAAPAGRWQKKAWLLALVNMLLAVVLFTNIYLGTPGAPSPVPLSVTLLSWLRALWLALAFVWLLLQLYPLVLLLEEEDREWQGLLWRNARTFLHARPSTVVLLSLAVLVITLVNTLLPALWLFIILALLLAAVTLGARNLLDFWRESRLGSRPG